MMNYFTKKIQRLTPVVVQSAFVLGLLARVLVPTGTLAETTPPTVDDSPVLETVLSARPEDRLMYPSVVVPDRKVKAVLTAYSSTPDQTDGDPFIAASNKRVYDGMIAANWLPFGTRVKIPELFGDKIFTVDDRMNARYGFGRIDVWMEAERKAVNKFGVKRTTVEIYYPSSLKSPLAKSLMNKQIARR
jgi:3D (Asp-Asp-Asp) domain-containing protein